jgi:hypothetical protein
MNRLDRNETKAMRPFGGAIATACLAHVADGLVVRAQEWAASIGGESL